MKLVVFSDLHADATTAGLDRFEDVEVACFEAVDGARQERADLVLFLGDLSDPDTTRSHRAGALAGRVASALASDGIPSRWLVGNHDVVEDGHGTSTLSPLAGSGTAAVHDGPSAGFVPLPRGGVSLVALPYPPRSRTYDPEAFVREHGPALVSSMRRDAPLVVAGHLMIRGADPGSESAELARGRDVFYPWEACREVFGPKALLLCGHYHRRQVAAGGIQIPGSLARLRFDEELHEPGYLVCESGPGGAWSVRFVRVKARPLATFGADNASAWFADWKAAAPIVRSGGAGGAIVRLRPPADASDDRIALAKAELEAGGAAVVRVEPRAIGTKTIAPEKATPESRRAPRAVAMEMAAEARTRDRAALVDVLDRELATQKL